MILGCFIGYFCPGKFPKNSVLNLKKQIPLLWISNPLQSFVPAFVLTSHINLANKETSTFVFTRVFWASFVTLWLEVWPYVYKWEFIIVFLSAGSFSLTLCFHLHFWPVSKVCSQIHKWCMIWMWGSNSVPAHEYQALLLHSQNSANLFFRDFFQENVAFHEKSVSASSQEHLLCI